MRILLVEDDALVSKIFAKYLRKHGHEVDVVDAYANALLRVDQSPIELALVDHDLRDGALGYTLFQHMRVHHPSVPRCLMTGGAWASASVVRGAYECFHPKPFSLRTFDELIVWAQSLSSQSAVWAEAQ